MTLDHDDDGMPLHDSEEGRAMSAARRLALRDAAPDLLAALRQGIDALNEQMREARALGWGDSTTQQRGEEAMQAMLAAITKAGG